MSPRRPQLRPGFSMIELLMALALTLLMMGAVVTIFGLINSSMTDSRATVEMNGRLQSAADRLQRDLDGLTLPVVPWTRPESGQGYFEYVEGPRHDFESPLYPQEVNRDASERDGFPPPLALVGDIDDILMFTTRSRGQPFVGLVDPPPGSPAQPNPQVLQSDVAEVIYFCAPDATSLAQSRLFTEIPAGATAAQKRANELRREVTYTLYRQVRLVYPTSKIFDGMLPRLPSLDLSYRVESIGGAPRFLLNSLGDLTKRENRAYRNLKGFPFEIGSPRGSLSYNAAFPQPDLWSYGKPRVMPDGSTVDTMSRIGLDVLLTNVLAFDVKAWDPTAVVRASNTGSNTESGTTGTVVYQPGEPNYDAPKLSELSRGAYVDLNFARRYRNPAQVPASTFSAAPNPRCQLTVPAFYDTWSLHYEFDGIDQDRNGIVDQANNGVDDNSNPNDPTNAGVDDASERETSPPYPVALRGIQIRVRTYEPDSRQVRQVTINGDFLPE